MIENPTNEQVISPVPRSTRTRRSQNACSAYYSGLVHRVQSKAKSSSESLSIGLVGCHANSGVSTISANFALSCSYDLEQDVLLISANPGDNGLCKILDLKPKSGLNGIVSGESSFEDSVMLSSKGDLHLIASGRSSREVFSPYLVSRFPAVIDQAKENFRVVIVDLQPVDKGSSSAAIASQLDAVVLVVDGARTRKESAKKAKRILERNGANLVGSILNR